MKPMSKSAVLRELSNELDIPVIDLPLVSPYGPDVKITSLATVETSDDTPLYPFEERQLKNLLQQVEAAPQRVKAAFYAALLK
jgi:ribosome recycling factor